MSVPSNLIPTKISALREYEGSDASGFITYVIDGRTWKVRFTTLISGGIVPTTRQVIAGQGLSGGGPLSSDVTLSADFSDAAPAALGPASAGVSIELSRGDHVHPPVNLSDTTQTQGVLPLGRGGTGTALSPVAGAVAYSGAVGFALTAAGAAGQPLLSGGGGAPTWGTLSVSYGGTGATTAAGARVNILPALAGNAGRVLAVNVGETDVEWVAASTGTVTSVNASGGMTGLTFTGGPITGAGTLTLGGTLAIANGGTGATNAADARSNLGVPTQLSALSDVQFSGLASGQTMIYNNTSGRWENALLTDGANISITEGAGSITISLTGIVPIANGGTNGNAAPTAGAVAYGNGSAYAFTAAGAAGQVLVSKGSAAPEFGAVDGGTF